MASDESPYTAADRARWRSEILGKGQEIAERLSKILGEKNATLAQMARLDAEAPKRREDELREFLDHLMVSLRSLDTSAFGKCQGCETYLAPEALNAMPWATRCQRCPETARNLGC